MSFDVTGNGHSYPAQSRGHHTCIYVCVNNIYCIFIWGRLHNIVSAKNGKRFFCILAVHLRNNGVFGA